jgi:glyoxylase-like metal-dependent hydrolase (beta-lactamase superfamily II)
VKLFFHYCRYGFSNCYLLGTETAGDQKSEKRSALIVDPGCMDEAILGFIEDHDYTLRGILITHDHRHHVHGLKTIRRIYNAEIFAVNHIIQDLRTTMVKDGDILSLGPFLAEVISVPGHSSDSAIFKIEHLLFTGDALTAGLVGSTVSSYGASMQMTALRSKIFSLPGNYIILPGHGPPTSLEAERQFNAGIRYYEHNKNRRAAFSAEFWL